MKQHLLHLCVFVCEFDYNSSLDKQRTVHFFSTVPTFLIDQLNPQELFT